MGLRPCERHFEGHQQLLAEAVCEAALCCVRGWPFVSSTSELTLAEREVLSDRTRKLTNVARPRIRFVTFEQLGRDLSGMTTKRPPEMLHQDGDVSLSPSQRWQLHATDGESIVEVIAKTSELHLVVEVATC